MRRGLAKLLGITRADMLLVSALLLLAAVLLLLPLLSAQGEPGMAVITVSGEEYGRYPLDSERTLEIENGGFTAVIELSAGKVRMKSCTCPDGICVCQGWLSVSGGAIVCLPAKIAVTLEVTGGEQLDAYTY